MPKFINIGAKSKKISDTSKSNTKKVEKLITSLKNLSNEIKAHGDKLQTRKEIYKKIAEDEGNFVKELKKPLKDLKKNLEELEYLTDEFRGELNVRNLSVSVCPSLSQLKEDISASLTFVGMLESKRIEGKYGLNKEYTGQYLTISKKSSGRGISCSDACEEIEKTVLNLKKGDISPKEAKEIEGKYSGLLDVSKKGLANLEEKAKKEISKSGANANKINLAQQYAACRTRLNAKITGLNRRLQTGKNILKEAKHTAPSDDSLISNIESWVKSVTVKSGLLFLGTIIASNIGSISKFIYGWVMGE